MMGRRCILGLAFVLALLLPAAPARAACAPCCGGAGACCPILDCTFAPADMIEESHFYNRNNITDILASHMKDLRTWWSDEFYLYVFLPALTELAQQSTAGAAQDVVHAAARADAGLAARAQDLSTKNTAKAVMNYVPPMTPEGDGLGKTETLNIYVTATAPGVTQDDRTLMAYGIGAQRGPQDLPPEGLAEQLGSTDAARLAGGFEGEYTIPREDMPLALERVRLCTPSLPALSAVEASEHDVLIARLPQEAWAGATLDSCIAQVAPRLEPANCTGRVQELSDRILANLAGNAELEALYKGDASCLSPAAAREVVMQGMMDKPQILAVVTGDKRTAAETTLAAAILENMIQYDIYRSQQRQEILVAGILMYEIVAHKKWRERNAPLLLALEQRQRDETARLRLATAAPDIEREGESP